jgi:hypothetical protein
MSDGKELLKTHYTELARSLSFDGRAGGGRITRFNPEKIKNDAVLDQFFREIEPNEARPLPTPRAKPSIAEDTGYISFPDPTSVGGYANVGLFPNGAFNYSGHYHDSGAPPYDFTLVCGVSIFTGGRGTIFTFTKTGTVHGWDPGSRDFDWNDSGTNPALAAAWPGTSDGHGWWWESRVGIDIAGCLQVVKDNLGTALGIIALF